MENKYGSYILSPKVFKDIAEIAINDVKNIAPAKKEDFVVCKVGKNKIELTISVRIKQGVDVVETCGKLQETINENLLLMTGVECEDINIDIVGFIKK